MAEDGAEADAGADARELLGRQRYAQPHFPATSLPARVHMISVFAPGLDGEMRLRVKLCTGKSSVELDVVRSKLQSWKRQQQRWLARMSGDASSYRHVRLPKPRGGRALTSDSALKLRLSRPQEKALLRRRRLGWGGSLQGRQESRRVNYTQRRIDDAIERNLVVQAQASRYRCRQVQLLQDAISAGRTSELLVVAAAN